LFLTKKLADVLGRECDTRPPLRCKPAIAAESIESSDERGRPEGLQCFVDVVYGDALLDDLVAIQRRRIVAGTLGSKGGVDSGVSGRLRAAARNVWRMLAKKLDVIAGAGLRGRNVKPPEVPTPGMAGGERKRDALWNLAKLTIGVFILILLELLVRRGLRFVPGLEGWTKKQRCSWCHEAEKG